MKQSWFRGVLFTLASMVTSFLGLVILSFPASVVLLPVSVYLYQAAMDSLFSSWSTFVSVSALKPPDNLTIHSVFI